MFNNFDFIFETYFPSKFLGKKETPGYFTIICEVF